MVVFAEASIVPALVLIGLGFVVGVCGHILRNNAAIATGIGLVFVGSLVLPLVVYVTSR
jgi:hypothetical protein